MERKRLIRWGALVGAIVAGVSGLTLVGGAIARGGRWNESSRRVEEHIATVTKGYQGYLDETAKQIAGLPADPKVIGEIQAKHFRERPSARLYVWASGNQGDFSFGVPSDVFARLNAVYDQYRDVIAQDNHYANRDQFLRTLVHHVRDIPLGAAVAAPNRTEDTKDADWWRSFREDSKPDDWEYARSNVLFLSSPIQDASGVTVGNLYLKLVDISGLELYRSRGYLERHDAFADVEPVFIGLLALSLIWLWFLLPSWVYIDARERDVPRAFLWALLTLPGSVFALMVYLISRPTEVGEFHCPQCAKTLNGSKAGCPYCGKDLSSVFCPQCQYPLKGDWAFCPSCRGELVMPSETAGAQAK